jgi:peptidoglycan/LPS O-acetylase OafA/YrhL
MRFAAALVVFGFHFEGFFYFKGPYAAMTHVFIQGPTGVSFFFILSGFVLTWSHRHGDAAGAFYRRRFARIGPLQVLTWSLMGLLLIAYAERPGLWPATAALVLVEPWFPGLTNPPVMNNPSWSLGCEAFFYALFPLLLVVILRLNPRQRRVAIASIVVAIFAVAVACSPAGAGTIRFWALYFFPPTRLLEFGLGMLLALEVADGHLPRIPLRLAGLVALGAYLADGWAPPAFRDVAVTVVPFMALIAAAAQADQAGERTMWSTRPLVRLGMWSFAIYLIHWPVLTVMYHLETGNLGTAGAIVNGFVALGITIALAAALYRYVEYPMERRLRPRPSPVPALRPLTGEAR